LKRNNEVNRFVWILFFLLEFDDMVDLDSLNSRVASFSR